MAIKTKKNKPNVITRIIVKYDVGFNNSLYIRGNEAGLNWDKGVKLQNLGSDVWGWESILPFNRCEFKVLINDEVFEKGENHILTCGSHFEYTPQF